MIEKLTQKQLDKFPTYREKWLKVGLSTETPGLDDTKRILVPVYTEILKRPLPEATIIMPSPMSAFLAACYLTKINMRIKGDKNSAQVRAQVRDQVRAQVRDQVSAQVSDQVSAQVSAQVSDQVRDQVRAQVRDQVSDQVSAQVSDQVSAQVLDQVSDQVSAQVSDQVRAQVLAQVSAQVLAQVNDQVSDQVLAQVLAQVLDQVRDLAGLMWYEIIPWLSGHFDAAHFSYYDFWEKECGIQYKQKFLMDIYKKTSKLGPIYPIENFCIVSAKPKQIHLLNGRIHHVKKPAVEYADMKVWALNGVRVPEEIVKTPAEQLDPAIILKTTNAEVRREIVRKIGIERMIVKLGAKSLDKSADGVYELLNINLGDGRVRPYLKMRNPSIATWHVEGVHPNCKTVAEALEWRNQSKEAPAQLS